MSEHSSRSLPELHKKAIDLAVSVGNDWMLTLIKAMNPKKLSPADIDMLESYLEEQ